MGTIPMGIEIVFQLTNMEIADDMSYVNQQVTMDIDWVAVDGNFANDAITIITETDNSCNTLPIELLEFKVHAVENKRALLNWSTATETENAYFSVQRSPDGIKWQEIGQVKGAGNSLTELYYSFIDHEPYEGINYYRLQQFDTDGASSFSPVRIAKIQKGERAFSSSVYPNPSVEKFYLQLNGAPDESWQIGIFNQAGKELQTLISDGKSTESNVEALETGLYMIDMQRYPSGYYLIRIMDDRGAIIDTLPMVKK